MKHLLHSMDSQIKIHRKQQSARRRFETRELLDKLKSKPCADCGGKFHPCQMDFYRLIDGPLISQMRIRSHSTIISEVKKCILLCSNCCRLRTWMKQRAKRSEPGTDPSSDSA